ncbi:acyltransferase family protein [Brachybacterium sp. AOP3-A1-3]|uniref:acyltransferase family protein n=1 Tax=Brachybacterium sp. AOP3-A1-3 TaxID=3457699 RepID=UPI0040341ED4
MPDGDPASPHPETPGDASTSGARTTTSRTTAARPPRDPFLDNARGILITLVVVGHTIESFFQSSEMLPDTIYTWIYSFHMAGFVMISGFLSRSYRNEPRQVRRLLTSMVVPYVIFQLIHEFAKMVLLGDQYHLQLFLPAWTLWFLLALMLWRLATPVLRQLRHPLVFAVAIAVISPLDPGLDSTLTVGRLVSMLPFFVVGLVCTPQMLERLKAFRHRWLGALVLLGALVCTVLMREDFSTSIFFLREAYDEDNGLLIGMVLRLAVLAVGVIGALALLIVTPRRRSPLTTLGERSLTVYLLHPLVLVSFRYADEVPDITSTWWGTLGLVVAALLLTAILGSGIVGRLTRWVTDPPIGHLLVKPEEKPEEKPDASSRPTTARS